MNKYTAIIPSKDKSSIKRCVEAVRKNAMYCDDIIIVWNGEETLNDVESVDGVRVLILYPKSTEVYSMFNEGVLVSVNAHVLLINDDMYVSKNFDEPWAYIDEDPAISADSIVTWQLCEPGYVDVNRVNLEMNFGKTWETFEESNFEEFNQFYLSDKPDVEVGLGWYMPVMFPKKLFIDEGMYPTDPPFPHANDIIFFEKLQSHRFYKIGRLVYHFQRLSQRISQPILNKSDKLNLCCGDDPRLGYINHDIKDHELNFDLSNGIIPLEDSTFSEVLFRHALEHFRFEVGKRIVKEIYRILKPNGLVTIHVPDLFLACEDFLNGIPRFTNCADAIKRIYGLNDSEQQVHKSGYTIGALQDLLEECGFKDIELLQTSIPDEICMKGTK